MREVVLVDFATATHQAPGRNTQTLDILEEFSADVQTEVQSLMQGGFAYEVQLERIAHRPPGDWPFFICLKRRSAAGGSLGKRVFDFKSLDTGMLITFRNVVHKVFQADDRWSEALNIDDQVCVRGVDADTMTVFICVRLRE